MNKISFNETYDIICHLDRKLYNKIPKDFIKFIEQNIDYNYKVNIDYSKSINEQKLQRDTRVLLSLIYRDYLCSLDEKNRLIQEDKLKLIELKDKKRKKYDSNNLFRNSNTKKDKIFQNENSNKEMQVLKNNWFFFIKRFFRKIKDFFYKK